MGCKQCLTRGEEQHRCVFATQGFEQDEQRFLACGSAYHLQCIQVGEPFRSRLPESRGLVYPRLAVSPTFICEACTVRAHIGRELHPTSQDLSLLMLERMRLVDQANAWARGTHQSYQGKLRRIRRFERRYEVRCLEPTALLRPPRSASIPLMWCQQQYTLEQPHGRHSQSGDRISYQSSRALRSAASFYYTWDLQIAHPDRAMRDDQRRGHLTPGVIPSDGLGYTLMAGGMSRRLGDQSRPPVAITHRYVNWINDRLESLWSVTRNLESRRELAAAAVTNLLAWLGWLRAMELFSLTWDDVDVVDPTRGPAVGLPFGFGVVTLRLLDETKGDRTKVADVVISYVCASGLSVGLWLERLQSLWPEAQGDEPLIRGRSGRPWDSRYFRRHHLYPWLEALRTEGDAFLQAFSDQPGNTVSDKFYSMGTYRRGGRAEVTKRRSGWVRATKIEIYEHGRWQHKLSGEDMPTRYNEFTLEDRLNITLLCM